MENFECIDCEIAFIAPSILDAVCPNCGLTDGVAIGWSDSEDYGFYGPDDMSDDAEVLAGVGWGTDEDYGFYGGEDW